MADPGNRLALFLPGLSHLLPGNYELSLKDFSRCIQCGQEAAPGRFALAKEMGIDVARVSCCHVRI